MLLILIYYFFIVYNSDYSTEVLKYGQLPKICQAYRIEIAEGRSQYRYLNMQITPYDINDFC